MRPRTIALLSVVAVVALVVQGAFVIHLARNFMGPRQGNNAVAFAPAPFAQEMPDEIFAPAGPAAAQPVPAEELQTMRRNVAEIGAGEISGPYTHGNLSVFFVHGPAAQQEPRFITLQEAVSQNLAVVHDTGFSLSVDNRSNLPLFIQGGDIVKGGNQDRVLPYDNLIPAGANRSPIAAFCVESGRSSPRAGELSASFQVANDQLPTRSLKLAALHRRSQADVWSGVSQTQASLGRNLGSSVQASKSKTSLQLTLEHPRVREAAQPILQQLLPRIQERDNAIGFVVAINGKIESADLYGSSEMFKTLWPKLLQASAIAALAERTSSAKIEPPSADAVRAFLAAPTQGQAYRQNTAGRVQLIRQESAQSILFETCDASQGNLMVHRCYLAK